MVDILYFCFYEAFFIYLTYAGWNDVLLGTDIGTVFYPVVTNSFHLYFHPIDLYIMITLSLGFSAEITYIT